MVRSLCLLFLLLLCHGLASAQTSARTYHPDFDCARMDRTIPGQVLVCSNGEAARSSLILDQAYYALRHQSPSYMLPGLKAQLRGRLAMVNLCFPPGAPVLGAQAARCYSQTVEGIAAVFRSRLTGRASEEASRPIAVHIALQRKLQEAGFLGDGVRVDGVYGEATRQAILRWQRLTGRPVQDGFMGGEDAGSLLSPPSTTPNQTDETATGPDSSSAASASVPDRTNHGGEAAQPSPAPAPQQAPSQQGQTSPSPQEASSAASEDEGAEIVPPADAPPPSRHPVPPQDSAPQGPPPHEDNAPGVRPDRGETPPRPATARDDRLGVFAGIIVVLLKVVFKVVSACFKWLILALVWLFLLPFRLIGLVLKLAFSNRYVLGGLGLLVVFVVLGLAVGADADDGKTSRDGEAPGRAGREDEEEEAHARAGMLWLQLYEATGIEELKPLIVLLRDRRRRAAFDFLEDLLRQVDGIPVEGMLEALAAARRKDSWKAFQRFTIEMQAFLRERFGGEDEEAAEEQEARARAYEKARRSGGPLPENAPWYVVLEVAEDASAEEITLSYRRLMKKHHPDRFAGQGGRAHAEAQIRAQKITEAYGYARTLDRFAGPAQGPSSRRKGGPAGASSSGGTGTGRSGRGGTADGFASMRDREAYQQAGTLWADQVNVLQLPDGAELLDHLVHRRLRASFRFLERTVRPLDHEGAPRLLEEIAAGRNWQAFLRCSRKVHDMLGAIAEARQAEQRRQQERKREEEAERRRQQQERARRQRERQAGAAGRPWHVVLEVAEDADDEEIRKAYRALLKKHHPDRFVQAGREAQEEAERRTLEITQAYAYVRRYRRF